MWSKKCQIKRGSIAPFTLLTSAIVSIQAWIPPGLYAARAFFCHELHGQKSSHQHLPLYWNLKNWFLSTLFAFFPAAASALGDEVLRVYAFTPPVFSCHFPSFSQAWLMTNPTSLNKSFAIRSTHILGTFHVRLEGTQKIQKKGHLFMWTEL